MNGRVEQSVGPSSVNRSSDRRRKVAAAALSAAVALCASQTVFAASSTWTGAAADGLWNNATNWDNGVPGANDGTYVSTDIATINSSTTPNLITVDTNRNVWGIKFDINAATATNVGSAGANGGETLHLTGGGTSEVTANDTTGNSSAINDPIVIHGTSYTFVNNALATNVNSGFKLNGNITGGATGATTITFSGVNLATSTTSNCQVNGGISNGLSSSLGVYKDGTGVWELRAGNGNSLVNDYSGDTIVNSGLLRLNGINAASPNSNIIVNNGGTVRFNVLGETTKSVKVNSGGVAQANADATITNINATNGPSIFFNFTGTTGAVSQGFNCSFTGTVSGQGGFKLALDPVNTGKITFSKGIDLGTVSRPFEVPHSTANDPTGDPDLQVSGAVNGNGGGIVKTGNGVLKLNNSANAFTGQLEIQLGSVRFNSSGALTGTPSVLIDGGDLNVQALTQTVGSVNITSGSVSANSVTPGTLNTPSLTFNVNTGDNAKVAAIVADSGGSTSVVKNGAGLASLTGTNTYSGPTVVNAGTLVLTSNATRVSNDLQVNGGVARVPVANSTGYFKTVSISGTGALDLNDNDLVVNNGSFADVQALVFGGFRSSPDPSATGIVSTTSQNDGGKEIHAVLDNSLLGVADWPPGSGNTISPNAIVAKYTYFGDLNLDGQVTGDDYPSIDSNLNTTPPAGLAWIMGDANLDGQVTGDDYAVIDSNLGNGSGNPLGAQGAVAVPEPTLLLPLLGGLGLMRRRRRA